MGSLRPPGPSRTFVRLRGPRPSRLAIGSNLLTLRPEPWAIQESMALASRSGERLSSGHLGLWGLGVAL